MAKAGDIAYATLRRDILDWTLAPGALLAEVDLSARLGLSRTPVREALARLVADGLAEPVGGRGLVVAPLSRADVLGLFELREPLERQAAALAAERRTPAVFARLADELRDVSSLLGEADPAQTAYYELVARFDAAVDEAAGNPFLSAALQNVRLRVSRIRRHSHDRPARLLEAAREHLLVVEAILDGDARLAADATRVHLRRSLHSLLRGIDDTAAPTAAVLQPAPPSPVPPASNPAVTAGERTPR